MGNNSYYYQAIMIYYNRILLTTAMVLEKNMKKCTRVLTLLNGFEHSSVSQLPIFSRTSSKWLRGFGVTMIIPSVIRELSEGWQSLICLSTVTLISVMHSSNSNISRTSPERNYCVSKPLVLCCFLFFC